MKKINIQMGGGPKISINPLIAFSEATDSKKRKIVKEQKNPNPVKAFPYRTSRCTIVKYVKNDYDKEIITDAIERLQNRQAESDWAKNDKANSILALNHFIVMNFPQFVGKIKCSFFKPDTNKCSLSGVSITISPDLVMRWTENGIKHLGAVKFKISKSPLEDNKGTEAAALIAHYLEHSVKEPDEIVDKSHCLYVDVMNDRIYTSPADISYSINHLANACEEFRNIWYVN